MNEFLSRLSQIKKSTWLLSLLTIGSLIFSLYRMAGKKGGDSAYDYFTADSLLTKWEKGEEGGLVPLENLLQRRQELHAKFDTKVAQHLLAMGQAGSAEAYLNNVQARRGKSHSLEAEFSNTSLLIEKGEYAQALEASRQLHERLQTATLPVLTICNQVRIGVLEGKMGNLQGELTAWEKVLKDEHFALLEQNIHSEGLSYRDYLLARCKLIHNMTGVESQK